MHPPLCQHGDDPQPQRIGYSREHGEQLLLADERLGLMGQCRLLHWLVLTPVRFNLHMSAWTCQRHSAPHAPAVVLPFTAPLGIQRDRHGNPSAPATETFTAGPARDPART